MSDTAAIVLIVICVVLFAGTPDLHDALVAYVTNAGKCAP